MSEDRGLSGALSGGVVNGVTTRVGVGALLRRSPSFDTGIVGDPLTPPLDRFTTRSSISISNAPPTSTSAVSSSTASSNALNPRGSHSLSRLSNVGVGNAAASSSAASLSLQRRFATYSPRHDFAFPSPPPSPITLRSLRVRDDVVTAVGGIDDQNGSRRGTVNGRRIVLNGGGAAFTGADPLLTSSTAASSMGVSPHHPSHPVRKRLSQRLAAWSKNFKAKFKKSSFSGGGESTVDGGREGSPSASSAKMCSSDLLSGCSLKRENLLTDRVVASDGRSCTLTRRHQLSSDLPALLRSSSTSPRHNHHHHPIHDPMSTSFVKASPTHNRTTASSSSGDAASANNAASSLTMMTTTTTTTTLEGRRAKADQRKNDSRTPVGIVQSSAFIVTTATSSSSSSPSSSSFSGVNNKILMSSSVVVDSSSNELLISDPLTTSTRSEGGGCGLPVACRPLDDRDAVDPFGRRPRRRRGRVRPNVGPSSRYPFTDDEDFDEEDDADEVDDDDVDVDGPLGTDEADDAFPPAPELPPRRRRVQSTDNILENLHHPSSGDRSLSSAPQLTTSLTTDDVASLRESGSAADRSSSDIFAKSIERLKECGWYWGPLSWEEASIILKDKLDGSFLVRDSSDDRYILSLSIRCNGRTLHTRIQHYKGLFSFWQQPWTHGCDTIVDFIERCMMHSRDGSFMYFLRPAGMANMAPMPLLLLHPVSRLFKVPSLHHLSRFAILKIVRRDNVEDLPLPPRLKEYLLEPQYLFEDLISGGEVEEEEEDEQVETN